MEVFLDMGLGRGYDGGENRPLGPEGTDRYEAR